MLTMPLITTLGRIRPRSATFRRTTFRMRPTLRLPSLGVMSLWPTSLRMRPFEMIRSTAVLTLAHRLLRVHVRSGAATTVTMPALITTTATTFRPVHRRAWTPSLRPAWCAEALLRQATLRTTMIWTLMTITLTALHHRPMSGAMMTALATSRELMPVSRTRSPAMLKMMPVMMAAAHLRMLPPVTATCMSTPRIVTASAHLIMATSRMLTIWTACLRCRSALVTITLHLRP